MSSTGSVSKRGAKPKGLGAYIVVTGAYWSFMLTDGALRMLVLLHFHTLGFTALELAYLFLLYELMGVVTNLSAGWIAARFGLISTLYAGLSIQIAALVALTLLDPGWAILTSVVFVMAVQGASGVAKDLTKMSAKSAVKVLAPPDDSGTLFRWVAALTGSKNAVKGLGFLLGAVLLATVGFATAVIAMAAGLALVFLAVLLVMPKGLPAPRKSAKFREVFSKDRNINRLSAARLFLFGARDTWFVVGIPIYFYTVLSDGSAEANRAAFFQVGAFMALWIIGYGAVQAFAPRILGAAKMSLADTAAATRAWCARLFFIPLALALIILTAPTIDAPPLWLTLTLLAGLLLFGFVFALNSSLHSFLILAFSTNQRVTLDVGFYYMSNAAGRLLGTLLSGLSYQVGGLSLCLATAAGMLAVSWVCARGLRVGERL